MQVRTAPLTGLGVSRGTAHAPALRLGERATTSANDPVGSDLDAEKERLTAAFHAVADALTAQAASLTAEAAAIVETTAGLARDRALVKEAHKQLAKGNPTAHAATLAVEVYSALLRKLGGYMAERVADLRDIRDRVVAELLGQAVPGVPSPGHPFVLLARDLAPADTAGLGDSDVVALVTEEGGPTSHTAILARALGIPAVVSCRASAGIADGTDLLVDGGAGTVLPDPSPADLEHLNEVAATVELLRSGAGSTRDGAAVALLANAGTVDAAIGARGTTEGIGLFRTELLFLDRLDAPTIGEQQQVYREVLDAHSGHKVVFRTLDAGADKPLPFLDMGHEENPALGVRGLRTQHRHPQVLADQLDALAAAGPGLWVMAPMVSTVAEAERFVELARSHGLDKVGVMIEVPAAALRARQLLEVVDFVSIGTNDLAQYTFAADRMLGEVAELNDPWQPALLDLFAIVGDAGKATGKPVGVCGEAAADPLLALVLTGLGATSLSMSPTAIPAVRTALAEFTLSECVDAAKAARLAAGPRQARTAVAEQLGARRLATVGLA